MAFKGKNKVGARFGRDIDPREAQAASAEQRKANKNRMLAIMATLGEERLTAEQRDEIDQRLLLKNKRELLAIANSEELPAWVCRRARVLLNKSDRDAVKVTEKMFDRAFGKPIQRLDANIQSAPAPTIADIFTDDERPID